jgi:hypothetical protein
MSPHQLRSWRFVDELPLPLDATDSLVKVAESEVHERGLQRGLSGETLLVATVLWTEADANSVVQITAEDLARSCGLENEGVTKALGQLVETRLIEAVQSDIEIARASRQVMPSLKGRTFLVPRIRNVGRVFEHRLFVLMLEDHGASVAASVLFDELCELSDETGRCVLSELKVRREQALLHELLLRRMIRLAPEAAR